MINKIAIAALGATVLGLGASHSGLTQPLTPPSAQAVDELTGIEITTTGAATDFSSLFPLATLNSNAAHSPGVPPPVPSPLIQPVSFTYAGGFAGAFSAETVQTTAIPGNFPLGGPGSVGSASISAGNPFTPLGGGAFLPLDINAVAAIQDCCGGAAASKQVVFDFTVTSVADSPTIELSLTQSVVLIAETIPGIFASASVGSDFEIDGPSGSPLFMMTSSDSLSSPACGVVCETGFTDPVTSGVLALSAPGSYTIIIDPSVQANVVFEPSSMLLLGSGLAGLGFAACRRKLRN
jgi:hypothetical protein